MNFWFTLTGPLSCHHLLRVYHWYKCLIISNNLAYQANYIYHTQSKSLLTGLTLFFFKTGMCTFWTFWGIIWLCVFPTYFPWRSSREKLQIFQPYLSLENSKHICTNLVIKQLTVPPAIILSYNKMMFVSKVILQHSCYIKSESSIIRAGITKNEFNRSYYNLSNFNCFNSKFNKIDIFGLCQNMLPK